MAIILKVDPDLLGFMNDCPVCGKTAKKWLIHRKCLPKWHKAVDNAELYTEDLINGNRQKQNKET